MRTNLEVIMMSEILESNWGSGGAHFENSSFFNNSPPYPLLNSGFFGGNGDNGDNLVSVSPVEGSSFVNKNEKGATTTFANLGGNSNEYIFDRTNVRAIFLVLYTIVFCSCFFGNLMVILVVTLHWRMRSITNFCLANLAFADLCVGIFCVYQNLVTYFMESWIFGEFMCKMYHFVNSLSTTASVLILVVICIERYLAIIHPMTCKQMLTLTRLRMTIVFVWLLSAGISSPRFYYFSTVKMRLPGNQTEVLCVPDRSKYNSQWMDMSSLTTLFLIPLLIISVLYTHIGIVLWKSSTTKMSSAASGPPSAESSSSSEPYSRDATDSNNVVQIVNSTLISQNPQKRKLTQKLLCFTCGKQSSRKKGLSRKHSCCIQQIRQTDSSCQQTYHCHYHPHHQYHESSMTNQTSSDIHVYNQEVNGVCDDEVKSSPIRSTCCAAGNKKRLSLCLTNPCSTDKVTSPSSPFREKNPVGDPPLSSNTDEIVCVKFEKGRTGKRDSGSVTINGGGAKRAEKCKIFLNTNNTQNPKDPHSTGQKCSDTGSGTTSPDKCDDEAVCKWPNNDYNRRKSSSLPKLAASAPKRLRRMRVIRSSKYGTNALRSRRRIIRMLIVVVLTFAVCHLPFHARKVWQYWSPSWAPYHAGGVFSTLFTPITFLVMYVNSGINPILYAFMSKKFRMSFRDLLCCKMRHSLRISRNASMRSTHVVALSQAGF